MDQQTLLRAISILDKNKAKEYVVKTPQQARELTEQDPTGHQWAVGDRYYKMERSAN